MNDYLEMKKWRRLACITFLAFLFMSGYSVYQSLKIHAYEKWMVQAYFALQFCSQALHGQQQ